MHKRGEGIHVLHHSTRVCESWNECPIRIYNFTAEDESQENLFNKFSVTPIVFKSQTLMASSIAMHPLLLNKEVW